MALSELMVIWLASEWTFYQEWWPVCWRGKKRCSHSPWSRKQDQRVV